MVSSLTVSKVYVNSLLAMFVSPSHTLYRRLIGIETGGTLGDTSCGPMSLPVVQAGSVRGD